MIGKLLIIHDPVDNYDCVNADLWFYPNGRLGQSNEYHAGDLYLRRPDFQNIVKGLKDQGIYEVDVRPR